MGLRFRHSVSLFPGVRLNFSGGGISTTIGVPGASLNLGPRGSYVNLGLPGTGFSYRTRISPASPRPGSAPPHPPPFSPSADTLPSAPPPDGPAPGEIHSAPVSALTSPGLGELKRLVNEATTRRFALAADVSTATRELSDAERRVARAQRFFIRLFTQRKIPSLVAAMRESRAKLDQAQQHLAACSISIDFAFDDPTLNAFAALLRTYDDLRRCDGIWDVTASVAINRYVERTTATQALTRKPVRFDLAQSEIINSRHQALRLANANGGDLYVYPGFVMMRDRSSDFALVDVRDLEVQLSVSRFIEEERVPSDSEIVGRAWKKANKDGSPDRRFSNNYQIPVVQYGELSLKSPTGLNEVYMVSSLPRARAFALAFAQYQEALTALAQRSEHDPQPVAEWTPEHNGDMPEPAEISAPDEDFPPKRPNMLLDWLIAAGLVIAVAAGSTWAVHAGLAQNATISFASASDSALAASDSHKGNGAPPGGSSAPTHEVVFVLKQGVHVRAEPSTSAAVVRTEHKGKRLAVFGRQRGWVQVGDNAPEGWIYGRLLGPNAP